jgi:hypothetical protein
VREGAEGARGGAAHERAEPQAAQEARRGAGERRRAGRGAPLKGDVVPAHRCAGRPGRERQRGEERLRLAAARDAREHLLERGHAAGDAVERAREAARAEGRRVVGERAGRGAERARALEARHGVRGRDDDVAALDRAVEVPFGGVGARGAARKLRVLARRHEGGAQRLAALLALPRGLPLARAAREVGRGVAARERPPVAPFAVRSALDVGQVVLRRPWDLGDAGGLQVALGQLVRGLCRVGADRRARPALRHAADEAARARKVHTRRLAGWEAGAERRREHAPGGRERVVAEAKRLRWAGRE